MTDQTTIAPPPPPIVTDYDLACALVIENQKASTSWVQRQLQLGYNTAAKLIERMEADGIIGAPNHTGVRAVLVAAADRETPVNVATVLKVRRAKRAAGADDDQLVIPADLPTAHRSADDRLRLLIERIERLEEEKKGIADDIRDVFSEAKSAGYDCKAMRAVVRLRKMRPDDRREAEGILDAYKAALGLD